MWSCRVWIFPLLASLQSAINGFVRVDDSECETSDQQAQPARSQAPYPRTENRPHLRVGLFGPPGWRAVAVLSFQVLKGLKATRILRLMPLSSVEARLHQHCPGRGKESHQDQGYRDQPDYRQNA